MKTEYEKCLASEPFIGGKDPKIVEDNFAYKATAGAV